MRILALLLVCAPSLVHALSVDAKAMARFDIGYADCEARMPQMRGHRDEAWLSLWRVKADQPVRAQLETVRKSADYRAERARVLKLRAASAPAAPSSAASAAATLELQCQALWNETQRMLQTKR